MQYTDDATLEWYLKVNNLSAEDLIEDGPSSERASVLAAMADYELARSDAFDVLAEASALVIVDMQVGFVRQTSPQWVPQAERMVPTLARTATAARALGIPVVFTSAQFLDPSPTDALKMTKPIAEGNLAEDAEGLEIIPELWEDGDVLIGTKHTYDAFWQTDLDYRLRALRRDTVIIAGTLTNFCCEATARAAFDRGYHVVMGSDLCASDNPWAHNSALQTVRRGIGRVLTSQEIIESWESRHR